jgi:predicted CoA-binding protein
MKEEKSAVPHYDITLNTALTPEQRAKFQDSRKIREILSSAKTIAVVGMSADKTKASNMVASYLQDEGYRIIPVNPRYAGQELLGEKVYASLKEVPRHIDIVDVFRPPKEISAIVDDAIAIRAGTVWTQLRLIDFAASQRALDMGLNAIVDKCIKMEHGRYCGALHFAGMNTEVITAQRRK